MFNVVQHYVIAYFTQGVMYHKRNKKQNLILNNNLQNVPYIAGHSTPGILQISGVLACTRGYITQVDTIHREGTGFLKYPGYMPCIIPGYLLFIKIIKRNVKKN